MKLLQSEVLIVPGRSAQYPQGANITEDHAVPGGAVVRLTNTTPRENAFKVRVRCSNPYWQENWVHPIALPALHSLNNGVGGGKPDQRGPQGRWVKVYVPRDGSRDILLRFQVPQAPDARAGRYPFVVEIETQVLGAENGAARRHRMTELTGTATIAPFYKWSIDLSPPQQVVGLVLHSDEFAVVVTNEGNDWLYCDLNVPRPTDMLLEAPTLRLALPPPEPGELLTTGTGEAARVGTQRSVPLRAVTQIRKLTGLPTPQPIALTATRVDAPSVVLPAGASENGSVTARETAEQEQVPGSRGLLYRPLVPSSLSMLFDRTGNAFQAAVTLVVGLAVLTLAILVGEENYRFNGINAEPLASDVFTKPGQLLRFHGPKLDGAKIMLNDIPMEFSPDNSGINTYNLVVPKTLDGKVAALKAHRSLRYLPFLDTFLPSYESKTEIKVNVPDKGNPEGGPTPPPPGVKTVLSAEKELLEKEVLLRKKLSGDKKRLEQELAKLKERPAIRTPEPPAPFPPEVTPKMLMSLFNEAIHAPSGAAQGLAESLLKTSQLTAKYYQQNDMAWAVQGYLEVQSGRTKKGEEALKKALRLAPDNFIAQTGMGLLAYQQGMQAKGDDRTAKLNLAAGRLTGVIAAHPYMALPCYLLGRAYFQSGLNEQALQQAQAAVDKEDPKLAAACQLQGEIYARMGRAAEAQAAYENALKLDPALPDLAEDMKKLSGN